MTVRRRVGGIANDVTADVVREALDQFHRLGRENFLRQYDAHPSDRYVIVEAGREADAKAVLHGAWQLGRV